MNWIFIFQIISFINVANNRMIEESTRPYITIYPYIYNPGTMLYGLIIKNSGPTGCVIDSFECDYKYFSDSINGLNNVSIEQTLIGLTLGPSPIEDNSFGSTLHT